MNPLLRNYQLLLGYIVFWLITSLGHFALMYVGYKFSFYESIADSVVFNALFAILGIGLWYPIYYNNTENKSFLQTFLQQLAYGLLSLGIWITLGSYIIKSAYSSDENIVGFIYKTVPWRIATGILLYTLVVLFYYMLLYYESFRDKQARETELQTLIKESELKTLKSQINPHFLFNSLNSISSLTMIMPEKAQEMVIKLSEFMRYSLARKDEQLVTLEREMDNINRYLDIEKIRFGERLNIVKNIDEACLTARLPALILQPIIENSIKYGVYESMEKSDIMVDCISENKILKVKISNTYDSDYTKKRGEGIGLINITKRMQIIYGRTDLIKIEKTKDIFTVNLYFPQGTTKTE